MKLSDLITRNPSPSPWEEGDNIPWNEPGFSQRMLKEHLSQDHDAASRRVEIIDRQVEWIHKSILHGHPTRILDMGCGPGLYSSRLAGLGHTCVGIDFSPASIAYAVENARRNKLSVAYHLHDLRQADYGSNYGFAMLIYGELNIFRPEDIRIILQKACKALKPGGWLLLEPHDYETIRKMGNQNPYWYTAPSGVYSDKPYLCLEDCTWNEATRTTTIRYYIVAGDTGELTRHAQTFQAYSEEDYRALLESCGFDRIHIFPGWGKTNPLIMDGLCVITARKRETATGQ